MAPGSNKVSVRDRDEGKILEVNVMRDFNDDSEC